MVSIGAIQIKIDQELCIRCYKCTPYCPVEAIIVNRGNTIIDQNRCVDCGVCIRSGICDMEAIYLPETPWPRAIRAAFSGGGFSYNIKEKMWNEKGERQYDRLWDKMPLPKMTFNDLKKFTKNGLTGGGRGTLEMKNNDKSGRYRKGEVGVACELGRPCIGFYWRDFEKVSMAIAEMGVEFEKENPASQLIDLKTGAIKPDYIEIMDEKCLSAIVEFKVSIEKVVDIYKRIMNVAKDIDTIFSLSFINKCEKGFPPLIKIMEENGIRYRINGKTNIGLGRPLYDT